MAVFRDVAPCSLVEVYRRFRGAYCLHHQDDKQAVTCHLSAQYLQFNSTDIQICNLNFVREDFGINRINVGRVERAVPNLSHVAVMWCDLITSCTTKTKDYIALKPGHHPCTSSMCAVLIKKKSLDT
jgi:hypothetical protein